MKKVSIIIITICILSFYAFGQNDVETYSNQARELENQGKLNEAEVLINKAIGLAADDPDLYIRRARIYSGLKDTEKMKQDVNRAISLKPDDERTVELAADVMYRGQIFGREYCSSAVLILDKFLAKHTQNDKMYNFRAVAKQCAGDYPGAYQDFSTASILKPDNPSYQQGLAGSLANIGDSPQALELVNKLILDLETKLAAEKDITKLSQLKYHTSRLYASRSDIYEKQENLQAMFADLNKMVEIMPEHSSYMTRAMSYIRHKKYTEAIEDYSEIIKRQPDQVSNYMQRGDLYFRTEKYADALNDYEKALKMNQNVSIQQMIENRIEQAKQKVQNNIN